MRKSLFHVLGATAALGAALLTTTAASAAPQARAAPAAACPNTLNVSCDTTVTFTVGTGALTITAPTSVALGTGLPGTTITTTTPPTGNLGGNVVVTDNRAALAASWSVTASATDWKTGAGSPAETIPATDVAYDPNTISTAGTSGTLTTTGTPTTSLALVLGVPPTVVAGTGVGDSIATWDPTLTVAVPASAVGGAYTSILTQSVV